MKVSYMVLNVNTSFTRHQHGTYEQAKAEASRLAQQNPGAEFVVLAAIARVKVQNVIVEEVPNLGDFIPF